MKALIIILLLSGCAFDPMGMKYHETQQNKALRLRNEDSVQTYWHIKELK